MKARSVASTSVIAALSDWSAALARPERKARGPAKTPPEMALRAYIDRVRAQQAAEVRTAGSIWSPEGRLVRLGTDAKAVGCTMSFPSW